MTPDPRDKARAKKRKAGSAPQSKVARTRPSSDDAHDLVYFKRRAEHDPEQSAPGRAFLDACPTGVRATMRAVLAAVATAPPKRYSGGGYWEAMKGAMSGYFEVRVDGPKRHHYRLFCILDYEAEGATKPLLVVLGGLDKPFRTTLSEEDYASIRALKAEYLSEPQRSLG